MAGKYIHVVDRWVLVLHIVVSLLISSFFVASFYIGATWLIYAVAMINFAVWVWNILNIRHIFNILLEEKSKWEMAATYDSLTGVLNRGIFINNLNQEIQRAHRYSLPMSLVIFDLDHFKEVNDQHGHAIGDQVLSKIAERIKNVIRNVDYFGRLGGEEFGIVLPETDAKSAVTLIERIRTTVERTKIKDGLSISISLGITDLKSDDTIDSIYERADDALYESKENGRNRFTII